MKRFLVGTAGHIDHGKTSLVKSLTGIDADRLPEEKRRGITIDLGFAHAEWEGVRVSFVDVPGHERFVRNMLAGAGGIDAVLLVVAADESVMPQTREHFEIVRMLGIRRGVVAVTKVDRVTPDLVEVTASDVRDLTAGSFLEKAAIVPVSARTGEGLPELRRALVALAAEGDPAREARLARLPIDRAFSIPGFGPVITGSLVSGTISKDQKLELLPSRAPVRVRRLEVHGRETAEARAGERVSANLAGVELSDLRRGLVLAAPGAFATTKLLTVRLDLLESAPEIASGDRLSFHHFSAEERVRVRPLDAETLRPGGSGRAQLRLSAPIAAMPGDRFVVRRLSPVETIGGGVVLDPLWPPIRKIREAIPDLDRLEKGALSDRVALWVEQSREAGAGEEELSARAGAPAEDIRAAAAVPLAAGSIHALRKSPARYVSDSTLSRLADRARDEMARLLSSGSSIGVSRRTLLARLLPREAEADAKWAEAIEAALVARGVYAIAGEEARPPGRDDLAGPDRDLSARIAEVYRVRGLDPPSLPDVTREIGHKPKVIEGLAGYLVKKGTLLRLPGGWLISKEAVDGVAAKLRGSGKTSIDVGEFKEMFGLTRRLAIPLLEYLDGAKITRRVGDRREILPG